MSKALSAMVVAGALVVIAQGPAAAQDRAELIRQADQFYQNFQTEPALNNLKTALDPTRGQPDSIWAFGVHLLAQIYWEQGDTLLATSWLRWAMRANAAMRVDASKFLPEVLGASEAARQWVRRTESEGDFVTTTRFEWPAGPRVQPTGSLLIEPAGLGVPLRVLVQGRQVQEGRTTAGLTPGSVEIQAAADGYLAVRVTREILPGVTTVLKFNLQTITAAAAGPPALGDAVFGLARATTAKLSLWRAGRGPTCASGFYAGSGYFVTTYEAIRGADSAVVFTPDGARLENRVVRVAAYDTAQNVAVLKLPPRRDSLGLNPALPRRGQWVWTVSFPDCGAVTSRGVRVALGDDPLELAESVTGAQLGGVVVDSSGNVLGLAFRGNLAIPAARLAGVLDQARQRDRAGTLLTLGDVARAQGLAPTVAAQAAAAPQRKRGFPIAIAVGGVAAAGGAAALLLLGGGGDGGGGNGGPTTGSIRIRFPDPRVGGL
jgi:S1-C subfamily serine protease